MHRNYAKEVTKMNSLDYDTIAAVSGEGSPTGSQMDLQNTITLSSIRNPPFANELGDQVLPQLV